MRRASKDGQHSTMPDWFPDALGAAQHQDAMARWKWWQRWLHRKFIAPRCPACIYWKEKRNA